MAVADDDDDFRDVLVELIRADPRFEVVAATADGDALVEVARRMPLHLALVDVRMPSGGAIAVRSLMRLPQAPRVVVVSGETSSATILEVLQAGAVGYLVKGRFGTDLGDLLARVASGEVLLAAPNAGRVLRQLVRQVP